MSTAVTVFDPVRGSALNNWPNKKTTFSSISIVINTACVALNASNRVTFGANIPIRLLSIIAHREEPYKVALDVVAFAALFSPYGQVASIAVDAVSEAIYFIRSPEASELVKKIGFLYSTYVKKRPSHDTAEDIRLIQSVDGYNFIPSCEIFDETTRRYVEKTSLSEIEARRILDLPETGFVDLSLVRRNCEYNIMAIKESLEIVAEIYKPIFEHRMHNSQLAYETLTKVYATLGDLK